MKTEAFPEHSGVRAKLALWAKEGRPHQEGARPEEAPGMRHHGRRFRRLTHSLLALALAGASGCLGFLHPVGAPPAEVAESCQTVPRACRGHVYVFLMNGLDPMNYGNLTGLRDYLQGLGFCKTYYGQLYHLWWFENEIRRLSKEDPDAHFALIGFSLGCNLAYDIARAVERDQVHIDLLVFLSGNHPVAPMPHERPENVGKVVNLLAAGVMATRGDRDWAQNVRLDSTLHFGSPTHPTTLKLLSEELTTVAASVPAADLPPPPAPPAADEAPTPRPVKPNTSARKDEWDFLKPVSRLGKVE
jgi:hypothetical protein